MDDKELRNMVLKLIDIVTTLKKDLRDAEESTAFWRNKALQIQERVGEIEELTNSTSNEHDK